MTCWQWFSLLFHDDEVWYKMKFPAGIETQRCLCFCSYWLQITILPQGRKACVWISSLGFKKLLKVINHKPKNFWAAPGFHNTAEVKNTAMSCAPLKPNHFQLSKLIALLLMPLCGRWTSGDQAHESLHYISTDCNTSRPFSIDTKLSCRHRLQHAAITSKMQSFSMVAGWQLHWQEQCYGIEHGRTMLWLPLLRTKVESVTGESVTSPARPWKLVSQLVFLIDRIGTITKLPIAYKTAFHCAKALSWYSCHDSSIISVQCYLNLWSSSTLVLASTQSVSTHAAKNADGDQSPPLQAEPRWCWRGWTSDAGWKTVQRQSCKS